MDIQVIILLVSRDILPFILLDIRPEFGLSGLQRLHPFAQATVLIFICLQERARPGGPATELRRHRVGRGQTTEAPGLWGPGYGATAQQG